MRYGAGLLWWIGDDDDRGRAHRAALLEVDPAYCDVIIQRWRDETGHTAMLDCEDRTFADVGALRKAV